MHTILVQIDRSNLKHKTALDTRVARRIALRQMSKDCFIKTHLSGTLRKNSKLGFANQSQYLHERVAYEFGWTFEILPRTRVTTGDAITEGDCKPITEAGWFCERYIEMCIFPEDKFAVQYMHIEYDDENKKEGIGLVLTRTSAPWVPKNHIVFAIVAEFDPMAKMFHDAANPS